MNSMTNASLDEVTATIGDMAAALTLAALALAAAKYSDDDDDTVVFQTLSRRRHARSMLIATHVGNSVTT